MWREALSQVDAQPGWGDPDVCPTCPLEAAPAHPQSPLTLFLDQVGGGVGGTVGFPGGPGMSSLRGVGGPSGMRWPR